MFLKNYTSNVPVSQTISEIEKILIDCGVQGITKAYHTNGDVVAVIFHIEVEGSSMTVRLPADKDKAQDALWNDYEESHPRKNLSTRKTRDDFAQQAERTAWRLQKNWVEVQMSFIQMKQADFQQVFLPYIFDARSKTTVYDRIKANGYRALLPEKAS